MSEPTIKELLKRISVLETAVESLTAELRKETKNNLATDRLNTAIRMGIESEVDDLSERMKNVELKFFPNLGRDICHLHAILPMDGKAWNHFDYRYPWKK